MTAEIAVLNTSAIALAADSAVTIEVSGGRKIYNSVNKLFTLSKFAPVGIMVYGSASFLGVPWETIVKSFRHSLGGKTFATLAEYSEEFQAFLAGSGFISASAQQQHLAEVIERLLLSLLPAIRSKIQGLLRGGAPMDEGLIAGLVAEMIGQAKARCLEIEYMDGFDQSNELALKPKCVALLESALPNIFERLPLVESARSELLELVVGVLVRKHPLHAVSGVVVAGFGESEIFPQLREVQIAGMLEGRLRIYKRGASNVDSKSSALIQPFAQAEMAQTFMEGIDPALQEFLFGQFNKAIEEFPRLLQEKSPNSAVVDFETEFGKRSRELQIKLRKAFSDYVHERHIRPIMTMVQFLPKEELAAVAEALVNLTSFRRRISTDQETVGGPIDVALISKGDGFVWIKRKHYFEAKLNPGFFANYYRIGEPDETGQ